MNRYKGFNGARRKLKRHVKYMERLWYRNWSDSKRYDELAEVHGKMFHRIASLPQDDPAWADLAIIRDELQDLDYECQRSDALWEVYG